MNRLELILNTIGRSLRKTYPPCNRNMQRSQKNVKIIFKEFVFSKSMFKYKHYSLKLPYKQKKYQKV